MSSQRIVKDSMDERNACYSRPGSDATTKPVDGKKDAMRWGMYYRTIRHLRLSQLLCAVRYQLERRKKIERVAPRWRWPEGTSPWIPH